jgi:hypothetical protein
MAPCSQIRTTCLSCRVCCSTRPSVIFWRRPSVTEKGKVVFLQWVIDVPKRHRIDCGGNRVIMATSRIGDPLGHDVRLANSHGALGCDVGCQRGHTPGPIRVADGPKDKSKKPDPAPTAVDTIIWHIYETLIPPHSGRPQGFTKQDFFNWFNASDDTRLPEGPGKWDTAGFRIEKHTDPKTGVKDFEKSLQRKGAIVVYIGHSTLTHPKVENGPLGPSRGLSPVNPEKGPEIPNATLRTLLSKSAASLVIIGSCDSKTAVGNISAGPPIIVANSGADRVTDISRMARAAGTFLFLLIGWELDGHEQPNDPHKGGHGTIDEALAASASAFTDLPDRFELVNGDGSKKLFP